jgi:hypothetical protein
MYSGIDIQEFVAAPERPRAKAKRSARQQSSLREKREAVRDLSRRYLSLFFTHVLGLFCSTFRSLLENTGRAAGVGSLRELREANEALPLNPKP